jgi:formyl-CoA transferase
MILRQVTRDGWALDVPGIVPKLSATPGSARTPAPRLGEDTEAVLRELGYPDEAIAALRARGVLA